MARRATKRKGVKTPPRAGAGAPRLSTASARQLTPYRAPVLGLSGRKATEHWYVPASDRTVHWGYFSKSLKPVIEIESGDYVTLECITHAAGDDPDRMIAGDPGVESVFEWTKDRKAVDRRGAGPMDAPNGAGGGAGVHIMTGPVFVRGAEPGDALEVRILDMKPRRSGNPRHRGKTFGTNMAAHWGYHYHDMVDEPKPREVVTIFELDATGRRPWASALYSYRWGPVTDPSGVEHVLYDYPGLIVDPRKFHPKRGVLKDIRVPIRPHFGTLGVAPAEAEMVSTVPPHYTGGNVDDWRIGKGATLYYPVSVEGALLSSGDPHAAQGDSELCGTAIESSWTGLFQIVLHKQKMLRPGSPLFRLEGPLLETKDQWVVHGFSYPRFLTELADPQQQIVKRSSLDLAMRDAFRKMRNFLMGAYRLSEDEAIALMSIAVDFGVTQVVDANWGVHASLNKSLFAARRSQPRA